MGVFVLGVSFLRVVLCACAISCRACNIFCVQALPRTLPGRNIELDAGGDAFAAPRMGEGDPDRES